MSRRVNPASFRAQVHLHFKKKSVKPKAGSPSQQLYMAFLLLSHELWRALLESDSKTEIQWPFETHMLLHLLRKS